MKHTPGPWRVTQSGVRNDNGYIVFLSGITHYTGQDERYAEELKERQANACLIAAAPDLLEALKAIMYAPRGEHLEAKVVMQAMDALEKAGAIEMSDEGTKRRIEEQREDEQRLEGMIEDRERED